METRKNKLSFGLYSESNNFIIYSDLPIKNADHEVIPTSWFFRLTTMGKASLLIFFLFLLSSCSDNNTPIVGHYYKKSFTITADLDGLSRNSTSSGRLKRESFLDFFDDGTYSIFIHEQEFGQYDLRKDSVFLESEDGLKWKMKFQESNGMGHFTFPKSQSITSLRKVKNSSKKDYPFTKSKALWRIKSSEAMSNNELISKFQNYCEFMVKYMRWAQKNDVTLSMKRMSGPLRYANNGLMMRRLTQTINWCDYFYPGDCERMDKILRNYFDGLVIDWKYTHDRIAMLSNALEQMIKGIENHKENFK